MMAASLFNQRQKQGGNKVVAKHDNLIRVGTGLQRLWDAWKLSYFEVDGRKSPTFAKIYEASFQLLPFRLEGFKLVPEEALPYLTAVNGYSFPKPRERWWLDRPRQPGQDPLEWILENAE